jgi:hypothetical protein
MGQLLQFKFREIAFDPDDTAALSAAYEKANAQLRGSAYTDLVREIIAKRIIATALKGERDPDRLCRSALAAIGLPG